MRMAFALADQPGRAQSATSLNLNVPVGLDRCGFWFYSGVVYCQGLITESELTVKSAPAAGGLLCGGGASAAECA